MKSLHRNDLFAWSRFDEARDVEFNSVAWVRLKGGNVLIDPLEMSAHDEMHLRKLGGASHIVVTNSEHARAAAKLADMLHAKIYGPAAEREKFPLGCERWLSHGDDVVPGLKAIELHGSKTPGELALLLEETTLITGDLIRGQRAGRLNLLPDAKLTDRQQALESVRGLLIHSAIETVLVGDGWHAFHDGRARLTELVG